MLQRITLSDEDYFALPHASNSDLRSAYNFFQGKESNFNMDALEYGKTFDYLLTDISQIKVSAAQGNHFQDMIKMRRKLLSDNIYKAIFGKSEKQLIFTEDQFEIEIDGAKILFPARCKFDLWSDIVKFGGDIKTAAVRDQDSFESAAAFLGYNRQAAWYMDISKSDMFIIFGVSKINHKVFRITIRRGDDLYNKGVEQYKLFFPSWFKLNASKCTVL